MFFREWSGSDRSSDDNSGFRCSKWSVVDRPLLATTVAGNLDCTLVELVAKNASMVLLMMSLDSARCHVSRTGLGSVIAALDAEFWATM